MSNFLTKALQSVWDSANGLLKVGLQAGSNVIGKVTLEDGANTTLGATTDNKDSATDTTSLTAVQLLKYISHILQASMGAYDGEILDDALEHTPAANHIYCNISVIGTVDVVVDTCTGSPDLSGKTLPVGGSYPGEWSSITLTSGEAIAYQKES